MNQSRSLGVGNRFQSLDNCSKVAFSPCAMRGCCSFDSMPQFRYGDGGNFQILAGLPIQPCDEVELTFLAFDDYIGIENYRHLSLGGFKALRAAIRSRCQALASLSTGPPSAMPLPTPAQYNFSSAREQGARRVCRS